MALDRSLAQRIRSLWKSDVTAGRAERPLKILIIGSFILPVSVFLGASVLTYGRYFDDARDRLISSLGRVHEHAIKVFDTFEVSSRYLEEMTDEVSDENLSREEAKYSLRIRNFIANLPQLRDLWVIDADGHPIVSGTVYPMPRNLDLSDRNYFKVQKETLADITYVSQTIEARAANTNFFAITRKRASLDGRFKGVNLISIAPEYFVKYYGTFPAADTTEALARKVRDVLAQHRISAK